jgi:hypothetical protein
LAQEQQSWTSERDAAAAQLEELAQHLDARERAVESGETRLRQSCAEHEHQRRYLRGIQAQWTARLCTWHGERERLLSDLRTREELVAQSRASMAQVLRRWQQRYQEAALRLKAEFAECAAAQQSLAELRALRLHKHAERATSSTDVAACVGAEFDMLRQELKQNEQRQLHLKQWQEELASKDVEVTNLLATLAQGKAASDAELEQLRCNVRALEGQNNSYRRQVAELHEEVERIARLLIGEGDTAIHAMSRAA